MITPQDIFYIKKTLQLAKKGMGWTNPNPMVGCIIVQNGEIISEGYHKCVGELHAEADAIKKAKVSLKGATLYVNLEPCSHFGRTPPCADAIIAVGIKKVVCSVLDPNPQVKGKGIAALEEAGIEVVLGVLEKEARQLNEAFLLFHERKRPFVALKFASSLDGKIATKTGDAKWITNEKSRAYGHLLRSQYQSIVVGIKTVLTDNPHLGARLEGKKDPLRIVLDPTLKIPLQSNVLRDTNVLIATTYRADKKKLEKLEQRNITVLVFNEKEIFIEELLEQLKNKNIISILVEGGGETLGRFIDKKCVDKLYAFYAPIIIGGQNAITSIRGVGAETIATSLHLQTITMRRYNDNYLLIGYP